MFLQAVNVGIDHDESMALNIGQCRDLLSHQKYMPCWTGLDGGRMSGENSHAGMPMRFCS